ncbi:MAG TPA: DUF4395 family protein [Terriglobia bacterium]|nr:DUF4395 family protein [Terriglobia bacterium]
MRSKLEISETVPGSRGVRQSDAAGISSAFTPTSWRDTAKRNFILQLGFAEPAPAVCARQYSALVFQPKVVLATIVAGIVFQSSGIFAALGALLWMSALVPKMNPISAIYNRTIGRQQEAFLLGPAPPPRRAAEAEAGTFALATALVIHAELSLAAHVLEAIFLAASVAVLIGSFCTGSFLFHLVRGRWRFVRQTLPWASHVRCQTKASKFQG